MERLKELEVDREDRRKEMKELLSAAARDKRTLDEKERQRAADLTSQLEQIEATIKFEQQAMDWDRTSAPAVRRPDGDAAPEKPFASYAAGLGGSRNPWGDCSTKQGMDQAFGSFLQAVATCAKGGPADPRLSHNPLVPYADAPSGLNTSVGSEGGFLVRTDFSTMLLARAMETSVLANRCTTIDIGPDSDGIELPYIDESNRATGSRWGGVRVYRRGEAETVTASKPKLGLLEIRLEDLMGICYTTDRAQRDAVSLGQIVQTAFASEFAFRVDDEIIRGSGAGQCLGVLNSGATVSVAKETVPAAQLADTFIAENALNMRARMPARVRPDSAWYINQELEPQLPKMNIRVLNAAGNDFVGGSFQQVFVPAGGLAGAQYDTLFGRPIIPIEQCSALGDQGDVFYLALREYLLIRKGALETAESIHVRFLYGENTYRFTYRVNGAPAWKTSLTPYKGANALSPFVTLDAR